MVSESGKNSDYFQDHLNASNWGIWTREIESKEDLTVIELHLSAQQVELITGMKEFTMFW